MFPGNLTWDKPNDERAVYLTFDDGPHPKITPFVLDILHQYNARATFFCIGENVKKHPEVYQKIIESGHTTGNHTYNHLNGWKAGSSEYVTNVEKASSFIDSKLFRPPYGRITRTQARLLSLQYNIIMWSVLSADFDTSINGKQCLKNVIDNVRSGSVIVFHDSEKAFERLRYALPATLDYLAKSKFIMKAI